MIAAGRALGRLARQELITADELRSTVAGLADTDGPSTGEISILDWIAERGPEIGRTTGAG